jgi:hypothetical protein
MLAPRRMKVRVKHLFSWQAKLQSCSRILHIKKYLLWDLLLTYHSRCSNLAFQACVDLMRPHGLFALELLSLPLSVFILALGAAACGYEFTSYNSSNHSPPIIILAFSEFEMHWCSNNPLTFTYVFSYFWVHWNYKLSSTGTPPVSFDQSGK